jgi:aryl-alcohol dehydrogenase-like predicted oxidoreductase
MPLARRAVQAVPALRSALRGAGVQASRRLPLTPELLTGSLEASLRRLGTDHLDLYALHDALPEDLAREPVLRALEAILAAGKARAVAVASDADAARAALGVGAPYGVVQVAMPAPGASLDLLAAARARGTGAIVHSVLGISGSYAALRARAAAEPALAAALGGAGEAGLSRLLVERAFAANPGGVVLVSMFSAASLAANLGPAMAPPPAGPSPLDQAPDPAAGG